MPMTIILTGNIGGKMSTNIDGDKPVTKPYCFFSVADTQPGQENAVWFNVKTFGKDAEFAVKYLKVGQKIQVVGKLEFDNYQGRENKKITAYSIEGFKASGEYQKNSEEEQKRQSAIQDDLPF